MFHQHVFASDKPRVVLNLGGIANITVLRKDHDLIGFDTGPANVLMDLWCSQHTGHSFDRDGQWGATGKINIKLLQHMLDTEPWFALPAPKSTGRDLFHRQWLENKLACVADTPNNIQATLRALTSHSVAQAIQRYAVDAHDVLVCGGGAKNEVLVTELAGLLPCHVKTTDSIGIPSQDVEALAFAWLAWANQNNIKAGNPAVTGAKGARILGALWKA